MNAFLFYVFACTNDSVSIGGLRPGGDLFAGEDSSGPAGGADSATPVDTADSAAVIAVIPATQIGEDEDVELVPQGDAPDEEVPEMVPMLSHTHGLYDEPFLLTLTSPIGTGQLRYTLDGSDPLGRGGRLYVEPLEIATTTVLRAALTSDGETALVQETATFLFPYDVPEQEAPDDWPDEWWEDWSGGPYEADYEMDPDVIESEEWEEVSSVLFHDLPIVSVVMDADDLFGEDGIYENPKERDEDDEWERAASVEMFDAASGSIFTVDCGIRIQGGASRKPDRTPKKSFRLVFKKTYGPGRLDALVYEDSEVDEFDKLVLRAAYNDTWATWTEEQRAHAQYAREAFASNLHRRMGDIAPRVQPAHLFLNGIYWGLYLVQERPDAAFMASYLGGAEEDWDVNNAGEVVDGDEDAWEDLMDEIEDDLSKDDDYEDVADELDIDRFIDYMLLEFMIGNMDWPLKNWYAARRRDDDSKWFFIAWDSELTLWEPTEYLLDVDERNGPGEIFQALRDNEEFRVRFGDRIQKHMFNGGALTAASMRAAWDEETARVLPGVIAESARWGDHWRDDRDDSSADLYTYDEHWRAEHERVTEDWIPVRPGILLADLQGAGLYPTVPAPELSPSGGDVSDDDEITLRAAAGDIYYTLDGEDPREEGGEIDDDAILYTRPLTLDEDATLMARVWTGMEWSALVEVEFEVD